MKSRKHLSSFCWEWYNCRHITRPDTNFKMFCALHSTRKARCCWNQ